MSYGGGRRGRDVRKSLCETDGTLPDLFDRGRPSRGGGLQGWQLCSWGEAPTVVLGPGLHVELLRRLN
jgi:hypothetical protein